MKKQSILLALVKGVGFIFLFQAAQLIAGILAEIAILARSAADGISIFSAENSQVFTQAYNSHIYEILLLSTLILVGLLALLYYPRGKNPFEQSSLKKSAPLPCFAALFAGFGAFLGAAFLISVLDALPVFSESQNIYLESKEAIESANGSLFFEIFYVCLVAPIAEEILCRGFILNTFRRSMSVHAAIFLSALYFGILHGNLYQLTFTLPLGILLGFLACRFDSILPGIFLHMAFNISNYLISFGKYIGYEEGSAVFAFCYYAAFLFLVICVPIAVLLLRDSLEKQKRVPDVQFSPARTAQDFRAAVNVNPKELLFEKENNAMPQIEFLVVGLGNPGPKYASNRHNCGFMALDYIALRENITLNQARFRALCAEKTLDGKKVLFMKPQTFMNLSGESVREAAAYYHIPPENVLVIFDDINFNPGEFRIRKNGSAGGHNGIKSIISCLGSEDFPRVKIGIGAVLPEFDLMNWVLSSPCAEDMDRIISVLEDVYTAQKWIVSGNIEQAMAQFNGKKA